MAKTINVLRNGLHQDNEPNLQPGETWRDLLNADFRNGLVRSQKGNEYIVTVGHNAYRIIGWASDQKSRILTLSTDSNGRGEIGIITISMDASVSPGTVVTTASPTATYRTVYNHLGLNTSVDYPISNEANVFNEESSLINRWYFSDRNNTPKVINILDTRLNTYIASGNIAENISYMVLTGEVTYNSVTYGPEHANGNIFTGANGVTTFTATVSNNLIEEIPIASLEWIPQITSGVIYSSGYSNSGSVSCGAYCAAYRLKSRDGAVSAYSYFTSPVFIGDETINSTTYESHQNYQGNEATVNSGKNLKFTIENIDQNYDTIELIIVRFTEFGVFNNPQLVLEADITGETMEVEYNGNTAIEDLDELAIISLYITFTKIGTMASEKNRMMVMDIELADGLATWEPGTVDINPNIYETASDDLGFNIPSTGSTNTAGHQPPGTSVTTGGIIYKGGYLVESAGGAGTITYDGNTYGPGHANGPFFKGEYGVSAFTTSGDALVYGAIRIETFRNNYRYIKIQNDFFDGKGVVFGSNMMSYMRGETYRFGILLWDKQKQPLLVKWLSDWEVPNIYDAGYSLAGYDSSGSNQQKYHLNYLGAKIGSDANPLDLTEIADQISGISIVRSVRRKKSIAQGMLFYCVDRGISGGVTGEYNQEGLNKLFYCAGWNNNGLTTKSGYYCFFSPEYLFEHPEVSLQTSNLKAELVDYLVNAGNGNSVSATNMAAFNMYQINLNAGSDYVNFLTKNYISIPPLGGDVKGTKMAVRSLRTMAVSDNQVIVDSALPNDVWGRRTFEHAAHTNPVGLPTFIGLRQTGKVTILYSNDTPELGNTDGGAFHRPLVNLIDPSNEVVEYGDIHTSEYISCGHFLPINSTTYADNNNSYIFKDIDVWGGDTYLGFFDHVRTVPDSSIDSAILNAFPCESSINFNVRRGRHGFKDRLGEEQFIGTVSNGVTNGVWTNNPENFIVDGQYNNPNTTIPYGAQPKDYVENKVRNREVFFSDLKISGESTDNFRRFLSNNSRELELSSGPGVALKRREGRMFVWQMNGISYLPIGDPTLLNQQIGEQILIGTTGVIERYDEQTERYGLQDRFNLLNTKTGFAWIDQNRMELLFMNVSGQIRGVSTIKGLRELFENYFFRSDIANNSSSGELQTNPLSQTGILSGYDEQNRMAYFTFHSNYHGDITIGFNEKDLNFTGFYSFHSHNYITHKSFLLSTPKYHYFLQPYGTVGANNSIREGFVGNDDSGENYIFIVKSTFVINSSTVSSLEQNTNLVKTYRPSDVFVHGFGDIGKYYGVVYDEYIKLVINKSANVQKLFRAFKIIGNSSSNTYSKITLQLPNTLEFEFDAPNFKFRRDGHIMSAPQLFSEIESLRKRLNGLYLIIKLVRAHDTTDITTSDNTEMKFISLITDFKYKY